MQGETGSEGTERNDDRVREDMKGIERGSEGYNGNHAVIKSV